MPTIPSYRRPINPKQLIILKLLYRFRFATSKLLSQTLNIPQNKVRQRLKILLDQDYIGRKDGAGFRQPGQYAIYYLKPRGVDALLNLPSDPRTKALIRRIADDADRSDRFIQHCLGLFDIYSELSAQYKDRIRFFTKSDLGPYQYFPKPLPDAYLRLDAGAQEQLFFLNFIDSSVPTRAAVARLEQFSDYADDDEWTTATGRNNPITIFVVQKPTLQKKLQRYIADELDNNPLLQVASKGAVHMAMTPIAHKR